MPDELRFDGRVAIVTGAGRGLGRAHARLLAARGAQVVVNDLGTERTGDGASRGPADDVVDEIVAAGGRAVADYSDVGSPDGAAALVQRAIDEFSGIDIVVNNAGIVDQCDFEELDWPRYEKMMRVHAGGSFLVTNAAWSHFVAQGYGRVVMTTSGTALFGLPRQAHHTAAKGAVIGMTRSLTVEARSLGDIKVNVVAPAAYTRMADTTPDAATRAHLEQHTRPEQVAPVVAWLAHERCGAEGQVFYAGGGWVARVFFAIAPGFTDVDLSIEDIAEHWDQICAEDGYAVPEDSIAAVAFGMRDTPAGSPAR